MLSTKQNQIFLLPLAFDFRLCGRVPVADGWTLPMSDFGLN